MATLARTTSDSVFIDVSPNQIAGLMLWLKADALSLNDGDVVGTWADSSGNGRDATQATASKKPLFKTSILNGKPVVRFDGVDDSLAGAHVAASVMTVFIVAVQRVAAGNTGFSYADSAQLVRSTGTQWAYWQKNASGGGQNFGGTPTSWTLFSFVYASASSVSAYLNGTLSVTFDPDDTFSTSTQYNIGLTVTNQWMALDVAEIIEYNSALSTSDRQNIERYLAKKYRILTPNYGTTRAFVGARAVTDSETLADAPTRSVVLTRAVSEATTLNQIATRLVAFLRSSVSDSATFSDVASTVRAFLRSIADSFAASDLVTRLVQIARGVSDAITKSDIAARVLGSVRSTTDASATSESSSRIFAGARGATEAITITEVASRITALIRATTDSEAVSDIAVRVTLLLRATTDSETFTDVAARIAGLHRDGIDSEIFSDVAARVFIGSRASGDASALTESASASETLTRSGSDSFTALDAAIRNLFHITNTNDLATVADVVTRNLQALRHADDFSMFSEAIEAIVETVAQKIPIVRIDAKVGAETDIETSAGKLSIDAKGGRLVIDARK